MTSEKREQIKRCVLAESVYNMLSIHGNNTISMVSELLRSTWAPVWAPVDEVVSPETVASSARWLEELGLLQRKGEHLTIPVRDPRSRRGRHIRTDYQSARLVWKGRGL